MDGITTNADRLAERYRRRAAAWDAGVVRALRRIVARVEQLATRQLSGSGAPGAYPVPVRTGNLRRSLGLRVGQREAMVFNTAEYAGAIHDGYQPYGNPNAMAIEARPFFADADREAKPVEIFRDTMLQVLGEGADA